MIENYLDYLFSTTWLLIVFLVIGTILGLILAFLNPFKSKIANQILWVIGLALSALCFVFPIFIQGDYGLAHRFTSITAHQNYVCLIDLRVIGEDSYDYYRLYALDKKNGKRLYRKKVGTDNDTKLIGQRGEVLFIERQQEFWFWDIPSGVVHQKLNKTSLPQIYPQLSVGIESLHYDSEDSIINVSAKNGLNYIITPYSLQLSKKTKIPKKQAILELYVVQSGRLIKTNLPYPETIFELTGLKENYKIKQITQNSRVINEKLTFLEGQLVGVSNLSKNSLIISYETTDKKKFILNGVDLQGKLVWQVKQSELQAYDRYMNDDNAVWGVSIIHEDDIVFTVGGFVFSVSCRTGKLNWRTRL